MSRVKTDLRIESDLLEEVKKRAAQTSMSLNSYIISVLSEKVKKDGFVPEKENEISDVIRIRCTPELKEKLKRRAAEEGMSVRALLNDFLNRDSYVHIEVAVTDLFDLLMEVDGLIKQINGIYTVMLRSGKVYEGEMNTVVSLVRQINDKVDEFYEEESDARDRLYAAARKKVFREIDVHMIRRNRRKKKNTSE